MRGRKPMQLMNAFKPVEVVSPLALMQMGIWLKPCKHCGCAAEMRTGMRTDRHSATTTMYGFIVCIGCSIQTMNYGVTEANMKFLAQVWNRVPGDGSFDSQSERGSHYGD